jgi:hypothetical protein
MYVGSIPTETFQGKNRKRRAISMAGAKAVLCPPSHHPTGPLQPQTEEIGSL